MNHLILIAALAAAVPDRAAPLDKAWYSPHELLPALAARDGIRWAMPETLAGRAWVGGELSCKAALDEACKQWGLAWTEANGIVAVHRADDAKLRHWTAALQDGSAEAAWELGWLHDARALPVLAEALAGKNSSLALAAAQAIETLLTDIPLGRDERVDPMLPGRVSPAAAFPPKADLMPVLRSLYPSVRVAALRALLVDISVPGTIFAHFRAAEPARFPRAVFGHERALIRTRTRAGPLELMRSCGAEIERNAISARQQVRKNAKKQH